MVWVFSNLKYLENSSRWLKSQSEPEKHNCISQTLPPREGGEEGRKEGREGEGKKEKKGKEGKEREERKKKD